MSIGLSVRSATAVVFALVAGGCRVPEVIATVPGGDAGEEPGPGADTDRDSGGAGPEHQFMLADASTADGPRPTSACVNLQCQQQACAAGATTSLSGTVYAPNGTLPLYNAAVYVPNAPLDAQTVGVSCDRCGTLASGKPIASALTDAEGKFKMLNVPAGRDIPLVIQIGKWRRKVILPEVRACQDNALTDPQLTRLPRNRSEGDLPRVAVTDGSCDDLVCLPLQLGVDRAELGVAGQDKAFTYFGGGDRASLPGMTDANTLWRNLDELEKYDMVINSCRCDEHPKEKGAMAFDAVTRYLNAGGRMFTTHYSYDFLKFSPDKRLSAAVLAKPSNDSGSGPLTLDTSFPKGKALADWMKFQDPTLVYGQLPATSIFHDMTGTNAQIWGGRTGNRAVFLTLNTPAAAPPAEQCGRLAHLDVHVTKQLDAFGPSLMLPPPMPPARFPDSCHPELTKAENVLAFFIFDLAACIEEDGVQPTPPRIVE